MDGNDKGKSRNYKMKHFAKLHERIQKRYEEMQKKLEKSRSVDMLTTMSEDFVYKGLTRNSSQADVREKDDNLRTNITPTAKEKMIVKEINKRSASLQYLNSEQADIVEIEAISPNENVLVKSFFDEEFSGSLESLNELSKETDKYKVPSMHTETIRDKIESRGTVAKEKCRQIKKGKNQLKEKKKESREKIEKFVLSNTTKQDIIKTHKKVKVGTVTVALIETTDLEINNSEEKLRMLSCRFRLGTEKYKSKLIKSNTMDVKWQELFNFNLYDDNLMDISLWDKDNCIGKSVINLNELENEKTHKMKIKLENEGENVQLFILLTISGTSLTNSLIDFDNYEEIQRQHSSSRKNYVWYNITDGSSDVGCISIIVYGAKGLSANDCYCVLELDNERLQTHTEYKTNSPNWMKIFTFAVTDITSILHITIHEEKKSEDIGKLSVPLLRINSGEKKWYALKDPTLKERAKGNNPRIFLEMKLNWNLVKASIRVINPKEPYYLETEEKIDRHTLVKNIARARNVMNWIFNAFQVFKTCFEWESRKMNVTALATWLLFCWFFKMWMLPLLLLVPFVWYRPPEYVLVNWNRKVPTDQVAIKKEEKNTTLRQKFQGLQEILQQVQNFIGKFADFGENIKNLFNFTVPFLSLFAIFLVLAIGFVMYMIPLNYILMIWGIHKFTRKILRPNRIPNNEILDLLSRVPNDEILVNCGELELEEIPDEDVIK